MAETHIIRAALERELATVSKRSATTGPPEDQAIHLLYVNDIYIKTRHCLHLTLSLPHNSL